MMTAADPISTLSTRLHGGDRLFLGWCALGDPAAAQTLARSGFDAVLLDMQHGAFEVSTVRQGISLAALADRAALVRIPVGDFAVVSRVFDAGAAGVVAPMINSADDARRLVEFAKFAPVGHRSWGPSSVLALTGMSADEYRSAANQIHLTIVMVETRAALDSLDEILAVDGVDGVLVGPSDLSLALSDGQTLEPHGAPVRAALDRVLDRCRAHGKIASVFCATGERAAELSQAGFHLCAVGTDTALLDLGARTGLRAARQQS